MQKQATTGKIIGYARVSTDDQDLRMQVAALKKAGCWNIYTEKRSATRHKRPQLELALMDLREGDTLLVWKFDRLVRNVRDAYRLVDAIEAKGCVVRSITEPHLEGKRPIDKFMFGMTALLAQLEVDRTSERTAAGIKALRDAGFMYGPKPMLSPGKAAQLVRLASKPGANKSALARKFGMTRASVNNYLRRAKAKRVKR